MVIIIIIWQQQLDDEGPRFGTGMFGSSKDKVKHLEDFAIT